MASAVAACACYLLAGASDAGEGRLPWPFTWLHPPKTGSHFAAAVSDLICDRLRAEPFADHHFRKEMGTEVPSAFRATCNASTYFGRRVTVGLQPHGLRGPSFADGHFPSTFDKARGAMRVPTVAMVRQPGPRSRSQFAQGMKRWCEGEADDAADRRCFDAAPPRAGKGRDIGQLQTAPISVVSHSFRLILERAIISRNGLEACTFFF